MWCCWENSCTYCVRISKTSAEGVQTSKNNVAKMMHWKLCEKCGFNKAEKWCTQTRKDWKILWIFPLQSDDKTLEHNRLDITVTEKKNKKCLLIHTSCWFDTRIGMKEEEKWTNYNAKYETTRIWKMRKVEVIPAIKGALEIVTKRFEKRIKKLDLDLTIESLYRNLVYLKRSE